MSEEETPKRRYVRKPIFGNPVIDEPVNAAVEAEADRVMAEHGVETDTVEVVEEVEKKTDRPQFIGQEPVSNSLKAKAARILGLCRSMEFKPWRGKDHWVCNKCQWTTFDKGRARRHYCE